MSAQEPEGIPSTEDFGVDEDDVECEEEEDPHVTECTQCGDDLTDDEIDDLQEQCYACRIDDLRSKLSAKISEVSALKQSLQECTTSLAKIDRAIGADEFAERIVFDYKRRHEIVADLKLENFKLRDRMVAVREFANASHECKMYAGRPADCIPDCIGCRLLNKLVD